MKKKTVKKSKKEKFKFVQTITDDVTGKKIPLQSYIKKINRETADYVADYPAATDLKNIPREESDDPQTIILTQHQLICERNEIIATMVKDYKQGKTMSSGRPKGSLGNNAKLFASILDKIYSDLWNEQKEPREWDIFLELHKQQNNYKHPISEKQLFTVNKTAKTISFEGRKNLMPYGTFCNLITAAKNRFHKTQKI